MICILHHDDSDGRASAAIVRRFFELQESGEDLEFFEMDYKKPIPFDQIGEGDKVFILDYSLKPEDMERLLEITEDVIWIDHHASALDYEYSQDLEGIVEVEGGAGCYLTWEYLFPDFAIPKAVELISDFDTFTLADEDSLPFQYGLLARPTGPEEEIWDTLLAEDVDPDVIQEIIEDGKTIGEFRDILTKDYRENYGFECEWEGHQCFCLNIGFFGSLAFGDLIDKYDIVISFAFDGDQYRIGLYSTKDDIDVSEIAVKHGGGGHFSAAGFQADTLPFAKAKTKEK